MAHGKRHDAPSARRKKRFVGASSLSTGTPVLFPWRHGRNEFGTYEV